MGSNAIKYESTRRVVIIIMLNDDNAAARREATAQLKSLIRELSVIRSDMLKLESESEEGIGSLHETQRASARNLLHYLALRRRDVRRMQQSLAALGLSSLGRAEPHALHNLDSVLGVLHRLNGSAEQSPTHQLRARRRGGLGADDRQPAAGGEGDGEGLPAPDGFAGAETPHRPRGAGPGGRQVEAAP